MKALFVFCLFYIMTNVAIAQKIDITITNIRNTNGNILLSFYTTEKQFPYKAYMIKFVSKDEMVDGAIKTSFSGFEPGEYALTLLDDENLDKDMNYRFFIPQEGYGFSNYYHSGLLPPDFEDCSFDINNDTVKVIIQVKYW